MPCNFWSCWRWPPRSFKRGLSNSTRRASALGAPNPPTSATSCSKLSLPGQLEPRRAAAGCPAGSVRLRPARPCIPSPCVGFGFGPSSSAPSRISAPSSSAHVSQRVTESSTNNEQSVWQKHESPQSVDKPLGFDVSCHINFHMLLGSNVVSFKCIFKFNLNPLDLSII